MPVDLVSFSHTSSTFREPFLVGYTVPVTRLQFPISTVSLFFSDQISHTTLLSTFIRPFTCPFICPFIFPSIRPFVCAFIYSFICPFIRPFVCPFMYSFICPFIRPLTALSEKKISFSRQAEIMHEGYSWLMRKIDRARTRE